MKRLLVPLLLLVATSADATPHGRKHAVMGGSSQITQNLLAAQWSAGVTSYAYYNANPLTSGATAATFEWRMRVPGSWPASEMTILQRDSASSIQKHIMLDIGTSRNLVIYIGATLAGAWTTCTTGTNSLNVDTNYLIQVVFDGSQATDALRLRVYANNVLQTCTFVNTVPTAMTIPSTAVWTIGATFNGTQGLRSVIVDDIAIWSGIPAAASQITERYNNGLPYDPRLASSLGPPIAYWTFEGANLNEVIGTEGASIGITNGGSITYVNTMSYQTATFTLATNPGCGVAQTANTQRQLTWSVNEGGVAVVRGAYLSIPRDYVNTRLYPNLFGYHGCSFTGQTYRADAAGPNVEAEAQGGVVALYPDGLSEPTCVPTNATGWTLTSGSHDLAFFDSMRYAMRSQVCFDETQLLVDGRSMGGGFVQVLSVMRPTYISRFMSVSTAAAPPFTPTIPVAMQQGHNSDDATVPVATARAIRDQRIITNGCTLPVTSPWNSNCTSYTCTGAPYMYCEWGSGGHTPNTANAGLAWQLWGWPGPLDAPPRLGPSANDANNFFSLFGDSTTYGSQTTALTTTPPWGSANRSRNALPFPNIAEGTGAGGSGHNNESPATALAAELRALKFPSQTTRSAVVGEHGCPGCSWYSFVKGSTATFNYRDQWDSVVGDAATARIAAAGGGQQFRVAGAVLRTGHNDDNASLCSSLYSNYSGYITTANADVVAAFPGQTNRFPIFWGQFSSWQLGSVQDTTALCATEIERLARQVPTGHVLCFPSYHLGSGSTSIYNADGIHFTQAGYDLAGEEWGLCIHAVQRAGVVWNFIPRSVTLTAPNQIDIDYTGKVPCQLLNSGNTSTTACSASSCCSGAPLVFDTTNINTPSTGDQATALMHGFELTSPSSARPRVVTSVSIQNQTHAVLTTDFPVPSGSQVAYAKTAIAGCRAGNGFATNAYAGPRGDLRDSMAIVGRVTGQTLYSWAPTWIRDLPGGTTPTPNVAAAFDDFSWSHLYVATSTNPTAAGAWADRGVLANNLPYRSGTFTMDTLPASLPADGIGPSTRRVMNPTNGSPAYWGTTGVGNHTFDQVANTDRWIRWAGYCDRSDATRYLYYWYGDTRTNNESYIQFVNSNGNVIAFHDGTSGGGNALNYNRTGLLPTTPQWCLLDVYFEARGGCEGGVRTTVCLNGDCATNGAGTPTVLGDLTTGNMNIGAAFNGLAQPLRGFIGIGIADGNYARSVWGDAGNFSIHQATWNRFCPAGQRPCL